MLLKREDENIIPDSERQRCEIYSRVVGYIRPVRQWNEGKQAEWDMRTRYVMPDKM